jgi:hypothetical protein
MRGMLTHRFSAASDDDLAVWHSFHLEFAAAPALCELCLTSYRENDDQAGADLGFFAYTYTDLDGTPHEVQIDWAGRVSAVAHDRMTRVDWYLRTIATDAAGLLNVFFWDRVW